MAVLGRVKKKLMFSCPAQFSKLFATLTFVDDEITLVEEENMFEAAAFTLILLRMWGVPLSWAKCEAGQQVAWTGFQFDYFI